MKDKPRLELQDQPTTPPPAVSDEDRLDWDACLERPPVRSSGAIQVTLQYRGRSKPIA
jgi:hypothetical protein